MKEDLFKDIIAKFLAGNATPHEKIMLTNWLKEAPDREEFFYSQVLKREIESPQYVTPIDAKVDAYEKYLQGDQSISQSFFHKKESIAPEDHRRWQYSFAWAASVVLFLSMTFYFFWDVVFFQTYTAQNGMIETVALADGSLVTLNANSSIQVPRDFVSGDYRELWLKGEAFFEVTRQKDLKFIVHTENLDLEVLGTKFNINDRRGKTEVILAEGKVKLLAKDQPELIMKPGEQVSISKTQRHFQTQFVTSEKHEAWRNNKLVFENTPLSEVMQIIQDYYGIEMILTDSLLASRLFTGTLPNNDLDVILLSLSTAYKIEIDKKGNRIILR